MSRYSWPLIILTLVLCLAAGCGRAPENEIRLGVNAELTGSKPTVGDSCKKAAELLAAQVNQAGGLKLGDKKYPIKLFMEDNEDKAESAAAAAQKLISQNNVLAIIGPNASGNAIPAARICEDAGVIMISPWSTNPKTTEGKKFVFRACFIDDFQGQVMAKFARENLKAQTAAVLYDVASEYNKGIAEYLQEILRGRGRQGGGLRILHQGRQGFLLPAHPHQGGQPRGPVPAQLLQRSAPAGAAGPAPGDHLPLHRLRLLGQPGNLDPGRGRPGRLLLQHPLCPGYRHAHRPEIHPGL